MNTWLGCPSSNFSPGRQGSKIQTVVIHTTVGSLDAANARFQNPSSQVSAHYGVSLDGSIFQWVKEQDTAWHAGEWTVNLTSIGIEHEDGGDFMGVRPDVLYTESAKLARTICLTYGIPIDRQHIVGHREVHATACPDALDIDRIVREAASITTQEETMPIDPTELHDALNASDVDYFNTIKAIKDVLVSLAAADATEIQRTLAALDAKLQA